MSQKSFTTRKTPIVFDIDGEDFYLKANVPAGKWAKLSKLQGELQADSNQDEKDVIGTLLQAVSEVMQRDSFARFAKRFNGEDEYEDKGVDLATFYEILQWIYGEALGKEIMPQLSTSENG